MELKYFHAFVYFCVIYGVLHSSDADCGPAAFQCADRNCVSMALKCDGQNDCPDKSDEIDCPSTTCSDGFFRCDTGKCISERWVCDEAADCPDGSDETDAICNNETCQGYRCRQSKLCIPNEWKCDGQPDCPNKDDEAECSSGCDTETEFRCRDNHCISLRWKCDGHDDCSDGSDEIECGTINCAAMGEVRCGDGSCIIHDYLCDGDADCEDESDEVNCTEKVTNETCGPTEFKCHNAPLDFQCIHSGWVCDGDSDCTDGSDEATCAGHVCKKDERMCDKYTCVKTQFFCDGEIDCEDGVDESNCTSTVEPKILCEAHEFYCGSTCIPEAKICDGVFDCDNGADESFSPHCPTGRNLTCDKNNGGCNQICIPNANMTIGRQCGCKTGFSLTSNSSTECKDVDECKDFGTCSQKCINTEGSYKCDCFNGYSLSNHRYCKATDGTHPALILSSHHEIRRYRLDTNHYDRLLEHEDASAVAIDFDIRSETLFWSDVHSEKIYSANITSGKKKTIIEDDIRMPDGIAVDWVHKNLYLSDASLDKILVTRLDGSHRKTLLNEDLDEPRALVVDPNNGWMYWTDWGKMPRIEKCGMNGQYRTEIVTKDISWPNGLTIDYVQQRLYWVDAKLHKIGSSDLDGNNQKVILKNHRNLGHPFAITVFEDYLYWTDWMSNAVHKISKFGHENISTIALGLKSPMDIHVYHIYRQPSLVNHCGDDNGGCSHLCLPVPYDKRNSHLLKRYVCACPDQLILDNFECKRDETMTTQKIQQNCTDNTNCSSTLTPVIKVTEETTTLESAKVKEETTLKENVQQKVPDATFNATHIETLEKKESVGFVAGIVIIILVITGLITIMIAYMLLRRHKSRNIKSFNFDNPVYRKTTTEEQLIMDKNGTIPQSMHLLNSSSEA